MKNSHIKSLISEEQLSDRIKKLANEINEHYKDLNEPLYVVGLLKGSVYFMSDLTKLLNFKIIIDFMTVSSYGDDRETSHHVKILKDLDSSVENKHILIIEDIIDTGLTLHKVKKMLHARHCASLTVCTLLDKPSKREVDVKVDWTGFKIEDKYVVGYGLDDAQLYRNLPFIGYVIN